MSQESTAHVKSQKKLQYAEAITLFRNCILLHNLKPCLFMKKMSINNFIITLGCTFYMDPDVKITKKFTKKFGSKVINRHIFIERLGFRF